MFGKKQNKKTKEKISKSKIGKLKGNKNPSKRLDVRKKISKALKGRKNTWSIKTKGIKRPNTSQSLVKTDKEGRIKPNKFKKGSYRKDLKQYFRSNWEANYARILNYLKIKWEYEPQVFVVVVNKRELTYRPDFYLPEKDKWIEVKGYWIGKAKQKFIAFSKKYNINLIDSKEYKMLALEYQDKVKWEGAKYV